jgi:hypothetical protein
MVIIPNVSIYSPSFSCSYSFFASLRKIKLPLRYGTLYPLAGHVKILLLKLYPDKPPPNVHARHGGSAGTYERVKNNIAGSLPYHLTDER